MNETSEFYGETGDPDPVPFQSPAPLRRTVARMRNGVERACAVKPITIAFFDTKIAATLNGALQKTGHAFSSAVDNVRGIVAEERWLMRDFWKHHHSGRTKVAGFAGAICGVTLADYFFAPNATQVLQTTMLQSAGNAGKVLMVTAAACYGLARIARRHASDNMHPAAVAGLCAAAGAGVRIATLVL